eukprot:2898564-Amphidinium_carterae.1
MADPATAEAFLKEKAFMPSRYNRRFVDYSIELIYDGTQTSPPLTSAVCSTSSRYGDQRYHHLFFHPHHSGLPAICLTTV